ASRRLKVGLEKNPFKKGDDLAPRIAEACKTVTMKDCLQWVNTLNRIGRGVLRKKRV
ncbi:hypothetical protein MFLAVUS_010088, partial [Mucor flavus]